ncbi:DUF47 domain-containing protein [Papillibacter cinnamivorans]|uniref:Phosphate transport regulator (Distant homolog of PhoU) n=1 Tax=Papillibacter cinnamivorans DSM 12816 TaxID=1122930 RepID=A0A1W1ZD52_9FIRM|nr:DUF47 family protein [Papillibacter cinnamivorans]SMC46370.1 hypothetical protein SAMN02745168_0972 [Papillibacter cinnamivorans DSM 12816]
MANKKGEDYFAIFVELVDFSCKSAVLLGEILNDYHSGELLEKMIEMHSLEHGGDAAKHVMRKKLAKEFITPIEREDIIAMSDAIDDVTDAVEDVLMRMYMCNIQSVREDALKMADIIVKCCNALRLALAEFANFRKSEILHGLIVQINQLEEEGDRLYTEAIRRLYVGAQDHLEVMAWDHVFQYLEKCCDACEDVADVIESVMLKNS